MTAAANPDCTNGRHRECSGSAWDWDTDDLVPCPCDCHRPDGAADLSRGLVLARLDRNTTTALAHAIGRDAAAHYDRVRSAPVCRRCCVDVADPDDPMGYCGPCAAIDASGR